MKDQIAKTEAQRDKLLAEQKAKAEQCATGCDCRDPVAGTKDPAVVGSTAKPVAGQPDRNQESRAGDRGAHRHRSTNIRSRLNQEPIREQQLADLTRGYDQSKASYDDLLKKKNDSAMATSMELLQQGERFRILDPPSLPLKPSFPNRLKFCGIGLFVGLVLGAGVVSAAEMMDDRVYSEAGIAEAVAGIGAFRAARHS